MECGEVGLIQQIPDHREAPLPDPFESHRLEF